MYLNKVYSSITIVCFTFVTLLDKVIHSNNNTDDVFWDKLKSTSNRPRVLGFVPEQIHNKLKISGNVQKTIPYNILKVPKNPPWAF